jgi:hypothetical protein
MHGGVGGGGREANPYPDFASKVAYISITVVIFCWRDCLISESMGHHDSEIMDDGGID